MRRETEEQKKERRRIYSKARRILTKDGQKLVTATMNDYNTGEYYTIDPVTNSTYWPDLDLNDVVKNPEKYLKTNIEYW